MEIEGFVPDMANGEYKRCGLVALIIEKSFIKYGNLQMWKR